MAQKKNFKQDVAAQFISAATEPQEATQQPQEGAIPDGYRLVRLPKDARLQLLVRQATKDAMRRAAEAQGTTLNELCNRLFEEYLERQGNT